MLPAGVVRVNVTLAPDADVPPLVTDAVIGTVPGLTKFVPETERLTASEGGEITVAFAMSVAAEREFAAVKSTA